MKKIILGSASPRRKALMEQMGAEFEVKASFGEEIYKSTVPEEIVKELATMKAQNVAADLNAQNIIVIGADTVVALDGSVLGKPKDEADAFGMLKSLQGREHEVFTGVSLLDFSETGACKPHVCAVGTKVFVHNMDDSEILAYIQSGEPMDKAGAYGIQGKFAAYIDRIEGDYYNVMGLPISRLYQLLKEIGQM